RGLSGAGPEPPAVARVDRHRLLRREQPALRLPHAGRIVLVLAVAGSASLRRLARRAGCLRRAARHGPRRGQHGNFTLSHPSSTPRGLVWRLLLAGATSVAPLHAQPVPQAPADPLPPAQRIDGYYERRATPEPAAPGADPVDDTAPAADRLASD